MRGEDVKEKQKKLDLVLSNIDLPATLLRESWHIHKTFLEYPAIIFFTLLPHIVIYRKWEVEGGILTYMLDHPSFYEDVLHEMSWKNPVFHDVIFPFRVAAGLTIEI